MLRKQSKKRGYQRRDWQKHVRQWQEGGLSQADYCRKHGLNEKLLSLYKKKFKKSSEAKNKNFVKIPQGIMTVPPSNEYPYEISLPGKTNIRLGNNFNPESLKLIIKMLLEI